MLVKPVEKFADIFLNMQQSFESLHFDSEYKGSLHCSFLVVGWLGIEVFICIIIIYMSKLKKGALLIIDSFSC